MNEYSLQMMNSHNDSKPYNVDFGQNRLNFQLQHQALKLAKEHGVFKSLIDASYETSTHHYCLDPNTSHQASYKNEQLNEEQNLAVNSIVQSNSPQPFLLFGPPGNCFIP